MGACSTSYLAIWHLCPAQGLHPSRLHTWQTCSSLILDTTAWRRIWSQANSMDQLAPLFATFGRTNRQNACIGSVPMQKWPSDSTTSRFKPKVCPCSRVSSGWTAGRSANLSCCSRFICSATFMIISTRSPGSRCSRSQCPSFTPSMSYCAHSSSSCCCALQPVGLLTCTCPCSAAWSRSLAALKLPSKSLLKAHGLLSRGNWGGHSMVSLPWRPAWDWLPHLLLARCSRSLWHDTGLLGPWSLSTECWWYWL